MQAQHFLFSDGLIGSENSLDAIRPSTRRATERKDLPNSGFATQHPPQKLKE